MTAIGRHGDGATARRARAASPSRPRPAFASTGSMRASGRFHGCSANAFSRNPSRRIPAPRGSVVPSPAHHDPTGLPVMAQRSGSDLPLRESARRVPTRWLRTRSASRSSQRAEYARPGNRNPGSGCREGSGAPASRPRPVPPEGTGRGGEAGAAARCTRTVHPPESHIRPLSGPHCVRRDRASGGHARQPPQPLRQQGEERVGVHPLHNVRVRDVAASAVDIAHRAPE